MMVIEHHPQPSALDEQKFFMQELLMSNLFDLTGKVAVITGSTKGIGRAIAEQFARAGARVVISSRKADACEQVAAELQAQMPPVSDFISYLWTLCVKMIITECKLLSAKTLSSSC